MVEEEKKELAATGTNSQCANCGGNLKFDPVSQSLKCANCNSTFAIGKVINKFKKPIEEANLNGENDVWRTQAKVCRCKTCGASIVIEGLNITTACPYCGSDYVLDTSSLSGTLPDGVVPFALNEEQAAEAFAKNIKKIFLAPRAFKKKLPSNRIRGIYVPSFAFDSKTHSLYRGVLEKDHKYTDSKGNTRTRIETIPIAGSWDLNFTNVTIESSAHLQNKDMKAMLPYDLEKNYSFNPDFLRGYSTEHYEDSVDDCFKTAKSEMQTQIKQDILSSYRSKTHYDRVASFHMETDFNENKYAYRILPVYCFEFEYKKKKYITYMNGQTGKIGTGYPKAYGKIVAIVGGIILLIVAAIVIYMLAGGK